MTAHTLTFDDLAVGDCFTFNGSAVYRKTYPEAAHRVHDGNRVRFPKGSAPVPVERAADPDLQKPGFSIPGWELEHTGGNCTGLRLDVGTEGGYYFLTDGDPSAPEALTDPAALTLYGGDGYAVESHPYPDVRAALVAVAAAEGRAVVAIERAIAAIEAAPEDQIPDAYGRGPLLRELRQLIGGGR